MKVMFAAIGSEIVSIEAVASMLNKNGHETALAFDRGLFDDKQYFTVPFLAKLFDNRKHVVKDILKFNPDLLAFSVFADNYQWCLEIARLVKKRLDIPVIMGGIHPTSAPDECITDETIDIICLGEGEYPLLDLANSMANGGIDYSIPNLWFKKDGKIIKNSARPLIQNLDELPLIDKKLFEEVIPINKYYLTVTNKGCLATCSYCSQNFYNSWEKENKLGKFFRERSVDSVINELKIMKNRYNMERIDIKNNVLSASKKWTLEFAEKYKKEIGLPYRIMGHPKTINPETAPALKSSGCWHVQIGIESLNPEIRRKVLNRFESNEDIYNAIQAMEDVGLNYSVDLMVGLPGEKNSDFESALTLFADKKHLVRASIFWLEYLPGVQITSFAYSSKLINNEDVEKINKGEQANYLSTGSIRNKEIKERLLNYQLLFRALPVLSPRVIKYLLNNKLYTKFKYFPQIPIIIVVDIIVSIVKKDHWAMYAMYSYFWELKRRFKRFFTT